VWRNGIKAFFAAFGSHRAVARAGTEALATSSEFRTVWSSFMQKWIDQTTAMINAERARGAAPETIPAADLAMSLNQMNERTMMATLSTEQPAITEDHVVDTLAHIWVNSIYGQSGQPGDDVVRDADYRPDAAPMSGALVSRHPQGRSRPRRR
jgi:hypothetical protein